MSYQFEGIANVRRTEWLWPNVGAGASCHLREGEHRITNLEWCRREVAVFARKGIEAQVRYNADGQVAVFANSEYVNYRMSHEDSYEYDPTADSAPGGGQGAAPVQEPELPDIESM